MFGNFFTRSRPPVSHLLREGHILNETYPVYSTLANNVITVQPAPSCTYSYDGMGASTA